LASPTTAAVLGMLSVLALIALVPLEFLVPGVAAPSGSTSVVEAVSWFVFGVSFTIVGVVVARREPRNPMGWLLLGESLAFNVGTDAPAYVYLDYKSHHGALPLSHVAILLSGAWVYGFLLLPLIIVLFPDGRLGSRWRWPLRAYLTLMIVFVAGTESVAVAAFSLRLPVDSSGNLVGLNNPSGWFGLVWKAGFVSCLVFAVAAVVHQLRSLRRSSGERRQQLKWLVSGGTTCLVLVVTTIAWSNAPAWVGDLVFPLGLTALPLCMGVAILRYRLYEIDVIIRRTLVYTTLVGSLAVVYLGGIYLIDRALQAVTGQSGAFAVTLSTLAVAALFQPVRRRIQGVVDHRFYRAKYDAAATLDAFTSRLRDQVDLAALHAEMLDVVNATVQPRHASLWIRPSEPGSSASTIPNSS
jgi:hypothetical protein